MAFLGDLGNLFHAIGGFLTGNDNNQQPTVQMNSVHQGPTGTANGAVPPRMIGSPEGLVPHNPNANTDYTNSNSIAPPQTLQRAQPAAASLPVPTQQQNQFVQDLKTGNLKSPYPLGPPQAPNTFDRAITTGVDAVARTAVGIPQGIAQLWDTIRGAKTPNPVAKATDDLGQQIDADQAKNGLNNMIKVDGEPVNLGDAIYRGAQVGLNVGPMVEGAVNAATKIPAIVRAAPDVLKSVPDLIKAVPDAVQGAGDAVDTLMNKITPVNLLNKANTATDVATPLSTADRAADEVAVGLKSANPNQAQDAAQQIAEKQAQQAAMNPQTPPTEASPTAPVQPQAAPQPTGPVVPTPTQPAPAQSELSKPIENVSLPNNVAPNANEVNSKVSELGGQRPENDLQSQIEEAHNAGDNGKVDQLISQLPPEMQGPMRNALGRPEPGAELPPSGRTAPNAPNVRMQLTKQLGDAAKTVGDPTEHNVLSNPELDQAAQRVVQNTPPHELLNKYSGVPKLDNAQDLAHAKASLSVLADLTKNENPEIANAAKQAIDNIMEGTEKGISSAGRTMNYSQSMYDSLPREAKISLTIRTLDKAREAAGMPLIKDDLGLQNQVEATLNNLLGRGDNLRSELAGVEGRIQAIQDAAKAAPDMKSEVAQEYAKELKTLGTQQSKLELQAQAQNGETARYYSSLTPGKAALQRASDWARTSMLTAPSGRINNVFNIGGNALYEIARSIPQAIMNKGVNAVKGAGTTEDSSLLNNGLARGFVNGVKRVGSELKGNALVNGLDKDTLANKASGSYELVRTKNNMGLNKVVNATQALVKAPSNAIGGAVKGAQLVRYARQEGEAAGLTGKALDIYAQARSLVPSKQMADRAQQLQDTVSHMNKNWLSDMAGKLFGDTSRLEGNAKGAAGLIKNTLLPFPKYASTFVWNTLTDRNVVADTIRAAGAIKNGDLNALTKAISGFAMDGTGMYVGYHLAQNGLITTKDGNGYSDSGAYLHLGNRYIPLGTLGVGAEPLLAGTAIHEAVNSSGDAASKFFGTIWNTVFNTIKAGGAQSLVGADNRSVTAIQKALTGSDGVTPADAAAVGAGQFAGQFIPGAFSDINAGLNHSPLNPTGEAANTKVTKGSLGVTTPSTGEPSTAKAIPQSEVRSLESRIPILSQTLERSPNTTAPDLLDRATRGSHVGGTQAAAAQQAAATKQSVQDKIAAGIPVYQPAKGTAPKGYSFDNTLNTAIQTGQFDKAIQGLQDELATMNKPGPEHIPPSTKQAVQDKITQLRVAAGAHLSYSDMELYNNTSVTAWRNMGDPNKSTYDPKTYQKLWNIDQALAQAGVAGSFKLTASSSSNVAKLSSDQKYSTKASTSKGGGSSASSLVKNNKIGSLPTIARENFVSNLNARPVTANIPQVKLTPPGSLIKAHKISVGFPRGNYN